MRRVPKPLLLVTLAGALGTALLFPGCSTPPNPWAKAKEGQKHVLTSFPPLYCLTQAIAGDDAYVLCLLTGTGPHDAIFSSHDALKLRGADLVLFNGLELDDRLMVKLINASGNREVPRLAVAEELPEDMLAKMGAHEHGHGGKGHVHHHGEHDPHVWLGLPQAVIMAQKIAAKLGEIDPGHRAGYEQRCEQLVGELKKLQADGEAAFAGKKNRNVLTMHESMTYFGDAFKLNVVGSIQPQPGTEPNATELAELERKCRKQDVGVVTYEPQYPKTRSEWLQRQLTAKGMTVHLAEFDPLETAPVAAGGVNPDPNYYLTRMRQNIANLAGAMR
jgi:zinc transport system substrate-binding protein